MGSTDAHQHDHRHLHLPNHHAHHKGFSGVSGLLAALMFTIGRGEDAELAVRLTGTGAGDDVVDLGCGPGVAARAAARAGAASVRAVDPSAMMLRVGRLIPGRGARVRYRDGSAEAIPLADDSASVVWSIATVHHWKDVDQGLAEVRRILRPGGRFLAIERHTTADATGVKSHGWVDEQAAEFAERCVAAGLGTPEIGQHATRRAPFLTILARDA